MWANLFHKANGLSDYTDPQTESQCLILASRTLDAQIDRAHLFAKRVWASNRRQEFAATKKQKEKKHTLFILAQIYR